MPMKKERLDKLLSNMGAGSRTQVKDMIKSGFVTVNGVLTTSPEAKVAPGVDRVFLKGREVKYREFIYLMLNKPQGMVSSTDDPRESVVIELLDDYWKGFRPFPVGRLDKDTEGLLLITNDGQLAHLLLSPRKGVDKTYYAEIDGVVLPEHVESFKKGVQLEDGYLTLPAELEIERSDLISIVQVTIQEGKYHQVKRMFAAHGLRVVYLKRIRMGSLMLDNQLDEGEYRELTDEEIEVLKKEVGMV
jgi:16S rRNA pseudouridine516 synthase